MVSQEVNVPMHPTRKNMITIIPGLNPEIPDEIWNQIKCPVLLFRGLDSWTEDPYKEGRIQAIQDHRLIDVPNAGHWVHHDQPAFFIEETRKFFGCMR